MVENVVNIVNVTVMITLAGVHIQVSVRANMNLTEKNNIESERRAATIGRISTIKQSKTKVNSQSRQNK